MADRTSPQVQDVISVGSRISWGAILGGAFVALAVYFMLTVLGAAVGLSVMDQLTASNLQTGTLVWAILTLASALFVGGLVTSLFTVGENKVEAVLGGVIMWAFLVGLLLVLATTGVRAGFNGMVGLATVAQNAGLPNWERSAQEAGVSKEQIEEWRRKSATTADKAVTKLEDPATQKEVKEAATRATRYAFAGTWISMMAAAAGAWMGAGPTFRIVAVRTPVRMGTA